jgi:hypothetical protein
MDWICWSCGACSRGRKWGFLGSLREGASSELGDWLDWGGRSGEGDAGSIGKADILHFLFEGDNC